MYILLNSRLSDYKQVLSLERFPSWKVTYNLFTKTFEAMTKEEVTTIIAIDLINRATKSIERRLNSPTLMREVKYNSKELNASLKADFDQITEILQVVIDKFYFNSYIVDSFIPLLEEDLDSSIAHNLKIVRSFKKVLKFIN